MDIVLYLRVLRRFKFLLAAGIVLGAALAFLAVAKVSFHDGSVDVSTRKAEVWKSSALLFVTQPGFPWGNSEDAFARLSSLTGLYAQLATSDAVLGRVGVSKKHPENGTVTAAAVPGPAYSTPAILPVLSIVGTGPTPVRAVTLTRRASGEFRRWLGTQQTTAGTAPAQRVVVEELAAAGPAVLESGRGKTLPIIVFLAVLAAAIGLAFVLDNVRPRDEVAVPAEAQADAGEASHRTAQPEPALRGDRAVA